VTVNTDGAAAAAPYPGAPARPAGPARQPEAAPELVQLLTPEGERAEHPEYTVEASVDEIRGLYRDLVLVRRIDTEAVSLQRQGELGIWASLLGQEAAQVGSGRALGPRDMVFPTYREHGVAWCRGLDPMQLLRLFRGVSNGGWDPAVHNFHLYTIVIGSQALHATGYAMGIQRDGAVGNDAPGTDGRNGSGAAGPAGEAVIVYFGDGATSQGDVNEAFIWASVFNAPVVFFCQNNQWAISEPLEKQSRIPLYHRARGFGFPGIRVDGNDVLACMAVTRKALQAAYAGQGPTLIEAYTYRMGAHTTTDDPTRYRLASELEAWKLKDPIERVKAYLARTHGADAGFFQQIDREADELGARIRRGCQSMPDPGPLEMFANVYAEPHSLLTEEREQFAAYLDSFADAQPEGQQPEGQQPEGQQEDAR
jgi:pyruvate dehydrogenase E1 component alpha subunit